MKLKEISISCALLLTAIFTTPLFAQDAGQQVMPAPPESVDSELYLADMPEGMCGHDFCQDLGLTDEQLDKLADLKIQYQLDTAQKKAELKAKRHEMMHMLFQPNPDKQKVMSLHNTINNLHNDICNSKINFLFDASSVLTPEQKKILHRKLLMHMLMMSHLEEHHHMMLWHHHE